MNEPNFQCPKTIQRWSTSSLLSFSFSLLSFTHKYPYKHNGSQVIAHIFLTHTHTLSNTPTHSLKHTHTHIHSPTHTSIFLALTTLTCCCFYFTLPSTAQALPPLQERSFCYEVTHVPVSLWSISLEESFQSSQSRNRRWEVLSLFFNSLLKRKHTFVFDITFLIEKKQSSWNVCSRWISLWKPHWSGPNSVIRVSVSL